MGDFCRLFSRSTGLNIAIYIIAVFFVSLSGIFWIYGSRASGDDAKLWKDRSTIVAVVGIITVSFLWAANMIYYEISFNKKCDALEKFLMRQKDEFIRRFDPKNLTKGASRVMAESLATEFKDQFGRAILENIKKEIPNLGNVLQQLPSTRTG